jgi:MIP family channel proteins
MKGGLAEGQFHPTDSDFLLLLFWRARPGPRNLLQIPISKAQGDRPCLSAKRAAAEFFGTFWLVFGDCGAVVLAAGNPNVGIGYAGVALAFGLTVLTMAYGIGHISGCHLNPALSLGLVVGKRFPASELLPYVVAQVVGAIAASGLLYVVASGPASFDVHSGFAANGYGANSPGGYSLLSGFVAEVVLTAFFLMVIMGSTDGRAERILAHRDRSLFNADSPRRHSGDEYVRKPGTKHRPGNLCGRSRPAAVVDVLGGAAPWRLLAEGFTGPSGNNLDLVPLMPNASLRRQKSGKMFPQIQREYPKRANLRRTA